VNPSPAREDRSGALVGGKYRLVRLLGRGGMGAVYEAENTWTRRRVAMKLLRPEYARDREALRRFMQEAQSASQIAHPNIIDVLDLGLETSDGSLYMVQELLYGEDLRARLKAAGGKLPPTEAVGVLVPILGALAAAHEHGVVHRDIKPENIFLTRDSTGRVVPKLIDFGVSKVLEPGQSGAQTGAGTALGTPRYMAPEQLRGEPDVDARADVWSVGVVLYELVSGVNPFEAPTAFGSANRVLNEPVAPLPDPVPRALASVVVGALSPSKMGRPAHARELLETILRLDEARGLDERYASAIVRRKSEDRPQPQPVVFELMSQLGTVPTQPAPAQRRMRVPLVALGLAAAAGIGWWLTRSERPPPPPAPAIVSAPVDAAVAPSPVEAPPPPKAHKERPLKSPTRPAKPSVEEGTNRAPIVE
jgi:serine/threonine-protein kinase